MNPNEHFDRMRMRAVRIPVWQIILISAAALALLAALAVVATGVFLVVFPIAVVGGWIYRLTAKKRVRPAGPAGPTSRPRVTVIDGEYEVVPADGRRPETDRR
jgi:amino acid transporter